MSNNPTFHTRALGAYSQSDAVTAENQYPDRFGQNAVSFAEGLDNVPVPPPDPLAALQAQMHEVNDLAARLTIMHKARKAAAGANSTRDAKYHTAMQRARESVTNASTVVRRAQGGTSQTWETQQAATSLTNVADMLKALLQHPTGRAA